MQIAHHFYAYFQCAPSLDTAPLPVVEIVVPTGGGGNITGEGKKDRLDMEGRECCDLWTKSTLQMLGIAIY